MVIFHRFLYIYQRVFLWCTSNPLTETVLTFAVSTFRFFDAQRGTLPRGKSVKGIGQRSDGLHHVMPGPRSSHRQAVVGGVVEMALNK